MVKKLFLALCLLALCVTVSSGGITDKLKTVIARKNVGGAVAAPVEYIIPGSGIVNDTEEGFEPIIPGSGIYNEQ